MRKVTWDQLRCAVYMPTSVMSCSRMGNRSGPDMETIVVGPFWCIWPLNPLVILITHSKLVFETARAGKSTVTMIQKGADTPYPPYCLQTPRRTKRRTSSEA